MPLLYAKYSCFHKRLEASHRKTLHVEWHIHWLVFKLLIEVRHHLLVHSIAMLAVLVDDVGEHNHFSVFNFCHFWERESHLISRIFILDDAFLVIKSTEFHPCLFTFTRLLLVRLQLIFMNRNNESINV